MRLIIANSFLDFNSYLHVQGGLACSYSGLMRGEVKKTNRAARLRLLNQQYTYEEMATRMGGKASPAYLSQIANEVVQKGGKTPRGLSDDYATRLEKAFCLEEGWFDLPANMAKKSVEALQTIAGMAEQKDTLEITQYEEIGGSMGMGVLLRDQPGQITSWRVTSEWAAKNIPANTGKENLCIVTGFGDSMRGMFNSGDPLIVDTGVKKLEYDAVYFFRVGDEGFIKRLQRIPGEGIRVISKNPDYESWTIKPGMDFEIFGRVLKVWRSEEF